MRFWDSSAIVPLLVDQPESASLSTLAQDREGLAVWWGSVVECASAIVRSTRAGALTPDQETQALALLDSLAESWTEIQPAPRVRDLARRLLRVHALRAADALQLAAALLWADGAPRQELVTRDLRLAEAARREGFKLR